MRRNRNLAEPNYHGAAAKGNNLLRGFNHLMAYKGFTMASKKERRGARTTTQE